MAQTFKIQNGDVVIQSITGRPSMIGNAVGDNNIGAAQAKDIQDLRRCLSISRLPDGSGAGITELTGTVDRGGFGSVSILIKTRIRSMFNAIIALQKKRLDVRPLSEQFSSINTLIVTQDVDKTSYRFRMDTTTVSGRTIVQSGNITP